MGALGEGDGPFEPVSDPNGAWRPIPSIGTVTGGWPMGTDLKLTGRPEVAFRPSRVNVLAGFLLAALFGLAGIGIVVYVILEATRIGWEMPWKVERGWSWMSVLLASGVGVIVMGLGVLFAMVSRSLLGRQVEFYEEGFRFITDTEINDVLWREITKIRETVLHEPWPILRPPVNRLLPRRVSRSYTVTTSTDQTFVFDVNSVKQIGQCGGLLRDHAERWSLRWETVEDRT